MITNDFNEFILIDAWENRYFIRKNGKTKRRSGMIVLRQLGDQYDLSFFYNNHIDILVVVGGIYYVLLTKKKLSEKKN